MRVLLVCLWVLLAISAFLSFVCVCCVYKGGKGMLHWRGDTTHNASH